MSLITMIEGCVITNGCFDIIHIAHLELLEYCRKIADDMGVPMVVAVNSDSSVKRLKGESRPVNNLADRCRILRALRVVDLVLPFEEDTPYELFKKVKPSIIIKGGDYKAENVVGGDIAKVIIFPTIKGFSTTRLLSLY